MTEILESLKQNQYHESQHWDHKEKNDSKDIHLNIKDNDDSDLIRIKPNSVIMLNPRPE